MNIDIVVKKAEESFYPFIFATWLHSYKHGSYFCKRITNTVFFKEHHKVITNIVKRTTTFALVASPKNESDLILGYIVGEILDSKHILHYLYVKKNFRQFGIAQALFEASKINPDDCQFDHWCYDTDWIISKYPNITYNPYLIMEDHTYVKGMGLSTPDHGSEISSGISD